MSRLARAFLGIAVGAILTLLLHPASRPILLGSLPSQLAEERFVAVQARTLATLPNPPKTLVDAGLWMQLGSRRLHEGKPLSFEEVSSLIRVAQAAAEQEPQNGFWRQMTAVFFEAKGDSMRAKEEWIASSKARSWSDKQSERLALVAKELAGNGPTMAWHYAASYNLRSEHASRAIGDFAEKVVARALPNKQEILAIRLATMRNGSLLSDGARSTKILQHASRILDASTTIEVEASTSELVRREKSRGLFYDELRLAGWNLELDEARQTYRESEGRIAITLKTNAAMNAARTSLLAIITAALPGALFAVSAIGLTLWVIGAAATRRAGVETNLAWLPTAAAASILGAGVYAVTDLPLASIAAIGCVLLLGITPKQAVAEGERAPDGVLIRYLVGLAALTFMLLSAGYLSLSGTPASLIVPNLPSDPGILRNPAVYGGLALLVFAVTLLFVPVWSFTRNLSALAALGRVLARFGRSVALSGLTLAIFATPAAVYQDARTRLILEQLVGNEPIYYVNLFEWHKG